MALGGSRFGWMAAIAVVLGLGAAALYPTAGRSDAQKNPDAMAENDADGANWAVYGRTFNADHYSPLNQIDTGNVGQLGLKWSYDLPDTGSLYTSPIAVNGVLYFSQGYSVIHAMDARTGKLLWKYDSEVWKEPGPKMRGGWGVRGIAYWDGKIYTATIDGRLIAINAKTGKQVWQVQTTESPDDGRYISGPPWVFRGKVVIGHGGADYSLVRGYVTAYDATTGKQVWRFYTVPGDPKKGFENEAMEMAAKTWTGEWWKYGPGGTAWSAMAYDAKFNRLYIGTGNGTPWNAKIRSPGGGDQLFLCSIVALDADTGKYVWHYQVNPGETWDYNSAMDIELTDMKVDGQVRPVLMHAPKNGFYYVIDRETGKLISAKNIVPTTWASSIDIKTGRPVEDPKARFENGEAFLLEPSSMGAHNVQPMSYSPKTGLAYITATESQAWFTDKGVDPVHWDDKSRALSPRYALGAPPADAAKPKTPVSYLLAWNAADQTKAWSQPIPAGWGGGVTSTGGDLVLNGAIDGKFNIYDARNGKVLWSFDAQSGISGQAITYLVDGKQYITVLAGYRGLSGNSGWDYRTQKRRVLTFALYGKAVLPAPAPKQPKRFADDPTFVVDAAKAEHGAWLATDRRCVNCHGGGFAANGAAPDLRESPIPLSAEAFKTIVHGGVLRQRGMPAFPELSDDELEDLRHYIRQVARAAAKGQKAAEAHDMHQ